MIKIYHNPRCGKSREGLAILENSGKEYEVIKYLEEPPSKKELESVITILGITPMDLVRTNEAIWKEKYKGKAMTDRDVVKALLEFPKLIERPIVIHNKKGVIGRPSEKIKDLLSFM